MTELDSIYFYFISNSVRVRTDCASCPLKKKMEMFSLSNVSLNECLDTLFYVCFFYDDSKYKMCFMKK